MREKKRMCTILSGKERSRGAWSLTVRSIYHPGMPPCVYNSPYHPGMPPCVYNSSMYPGMPPCGVYALPCTGYASLWCICLPRYPGMPPCVSLSRYPGMPPCVYLSVCTRVCLPVYFPVNVGNSAQSALLPPC